MRQALPLSTTSEIPEAPNMALTALLATAHLGCGIVLPLLLLPLGQGTLLLLVPFVLLTVPHWGLIHEAIHGHLHPNRGVNDLLGRALAVLFTAPFDVLKVGHLSHHSFNSKPSERPEIYDPLKTSRPRAWLMYYFRLLIGLYLAELLSVVFCFLPRPLLAPLVRRLFYEGSADAGVMADRAERQLLEPRQLARIRRESVLALLWTGFCLWLYGAAAWAFALALLARAVIVSFMDNAPHYAGELDDAGQGYDMRAPWPLARLILNTNLHGTHHRHPNVPWTALPQAFTAEGRAYAGSYLLMPWQQLKGPIPVAGEHGTAPG